MTSSNKSRKVFTPIDVPITVSTSSQDLVIAEAAMPCSGSFKPHPDAKTKFNDVVNVNSNSSIDVMLGRLSDDGNKQTDYLLITNAICSMVDDVFMSNADAKSPEMLDEDRAQAILALLEEEDEMRMNVLKAKNKAGRRKKAKMAKKSRKKLTR